MGLFRKAAGFSMLRNFFGRRRARRSYGRTGRRGLLRRFLG